MQEDKQEEKNKKEKKSIEEILTEEFEKELNQIIEENPDFDDNDIAYLKSRAQDLLERKLNQTKKGYFLKSTLLSTLLYFLSGIGILGFFFQAVIINPKWIIIGVLGIVSIIMASLDSLIIFFKNKFRASRLYWLIIACPLLCAVSSYFVNRDVVLLFNQHFVFSIIIVLMFILKIIVKNRLYKYIPKLRRSL